MLISLVWTAWTIWSVSLSTQVKWMIPKNRFSLCNKLRHCDYIIYRVKKKCYHKAFYLLFLARYMDDLLCLPCYMGEIFSWHIYSQKRRKGVEQEDKIKSDNFLLLNYIWKKNLYYGSFIIQLSNNEKVSSSVSISNYSVNLYTFY